MGGRRKKTGERERELAIMEDDKKFAGLYYGV